MKIICVNCKGVEDPKICPYPARCTATKSNGDRCQVVLLADHLPGLFSDVARELSQLEKAAGFQEAQKRAYEDNKRQEIKKLRKTVEQKNEDLENLQKKLDSVKK